MPVYVYETIPAKKGARVKQYEFKQSMNDEPLSEHPETGEPLRRVISGGYGVMKTGGSASAAPARSHSCGSGGCGCAH